MELDRDPNTNLPIPRIMWDTLTAKSLTVLSVSKNRAYVKWRSNCTGWVNVARLTEPTVEQVPAGDGGWEPVATGPKAE